MPQNYPVDPTLRIPMNENRAGCQGPAHAILNAQTTTKAPMSALVENGVIAPQVPKRGGPYAPFSYVPRYEGIRRAFAGSSDKDKWAMGVTVLLVLLLLAGLGYYFYANQR